MTTKAKFTPAAAEPAARARKTVDPQVAAQRAIAGNNVEPGEAELVLVKIPKAYRLIDDGHIEHRYAAGMFKMRRDHAEHWYSKANGVTVEED